MSDIPYHAWTHRPKAQGGTDPIGGNPTLRAVSDSAVFATPTHFTDGNLGTVVWGNWTTTNANIIDANTLISGDLHIFEGKARGLYDIKIGAAIIPAGGVTIEKVGFRFLTEQVGGSVVGAMLLYDETMVHPSMTDADCYYLFTTIVDVPPYDPEEVTTSLADPPTGFLGNVEIVVDTDGGDALLKEARLTVVYRGSIG